MSKPLYKFARGLFRVYFKIFNRWEVTGRENIPEEGKLVVMANHISYFDPPLVGCIMDRQVHFMAKEELFKYPVFGFLLKQIGQFPVKRGKPDRSALRKSFSLLKNGEILGLFPEGTTKGKGDKLRKAKSGAVIIPIKARSPILPVGIKYKGKKICVAIGKPFTLDEYYGKKLSREERREAGQHIMDKIASELKKI